MSTDQPAGGSAAEPAPPQLPAPPAAPQPPQSPQAPQAPQPAAPVAGAPAQPFAPVAREPWVNPAKRGSLVLSAVLVALVLCAGFFIIGFAVGHHRGGGQRSGPGRYPVPYGGGLVHRFPGGIGPGRLPSIRHIPAPRGLPSPSSIPVAPPTHS